ncbi:hypothetical protein N24_1892 [Corynebacterium suranareeae]|uniref:Uncharacterized protein n=1 Tax=Corynebacterium suranareeae TaxID=2506452 RepID=A0A160PRC5_9CORY|nr:ABC transporter permease [Corynebacterium suranareeae]BAU96154.1 hypothetical protein N24_1892 [Corynebacterium suranareeae]
MTTAVLDQKTIQLNGLDVDAEIARMDRAQHQRKTWQRRVIVAVLTLIVAMGFSFGAFGNKEREADAFASAIIAQVVGAMGEVAFEAICPSDGDTEMLLKCITENLGELHIVEKCLAADDVLKCFYDAKNEETRKEENLDKAPDYSMYRMASAMASFYSNGRAATAGIEEGDGNEFTDVEDAGLGAWGGVLNKAANGGDVLGYSDPKHNEDSGWFFGVGDANNQKTYSYDSLATHSYKGPYQYALFGATLSGLGLDGSAAQDSATDMAQRKGMGYSIMAVYMISGGIDLVFNSVLKVLTTINPFRLLVTPASQNTNATFTEGMAGGQTAAGTPFEGMTSFFTQIYNWAVSIGWLVVIPVSLGLTMMGILMMRRMDKGSAIKKVAIRVIYGVVGLPLLGVTYTGALDSLLSAGSSTGAGSNATKIVLSTYVDFQSWAENTRLQIPSKVGNANVISWDLDEQAPTGQSLRTVRNTTLEINANSNYYFSAFKEPGAAIDLEFQNGEDAGWMSKMSNPKSSEMNNIVGGGGAAAQNSATTIFGRTVDMLTRYIENESLSSGSFETSIRSAMEDLAKDDPTSASDVMAWVTDYNTESSIKEKTAEDIAEAKNPLLAVHDSAGLASAQISDSGIGFRTLDPTVRCTNSVVSTASGLGGIWDDLFGGLVGGLPGDLGAALDGDYRSYCNLSPLTMYNYLNTSFNPADAGVYSASTSTSTYSRASHNSVNLIGTGAMSIVYWFSAISLMGSFIVIGIGYAGAMLFNSIRRSISLIGAVPFAAMGFIAGVAKVIVYTVAMFIEIIGTIFLYQLITKFLMTVPALFEQPLASTLRDVESDAVVAGGMGLVGLALSASNNMAVAALVITVISSLGVIVFTIIAMKVRSSLVSGVDEAVTSVVNRFLDTQVSSAGATSGDGMMRRAAATGVGIGATHALLRSDDGGSDSGSGSGGGADGGGSGSSKLGDFAKTGLATAGIVGGAAGAGWLAKEGIDQAAEGIMDGDGDGSFAAGGDATVDADATAGSASGTVDGDYVADGDTTASADASADFVDGAVGGSGQASFSNAAYSADGTTLDGEGAIVDAQGNPLHADGTPMSAAEAETKMAGLSSSGTMMEKSGVKSSGITTAADVMDDQSLASSVTESGLSKIPDTYGAEVSGAVGAVGTTGADYSATGSGAGLNMSEAALQGGAPVGALAGGSVSSSDQAVNDAALQVAASQGLAPASSLGGVEPLNAQATEAPVGKAGKQLGDLSGSALNTQLASMGQQVGDSVNSAYAAGGMGGVDVAGKFTEAAQHLSQVPGQIQNAVTNADAGTSGASFGQMAQGAAGIAGVAGVIGAAGAASSAAQGAGTVSSAMGNAATGAGFISNAVSGGAAGSTGAAHVVNASHGPVAPGQAHYQESGHAQAFVQNNQANTAHTANTSTPSSAQIMGANVAGSLASQAVRGFGQPGQMGANVRDAMGGSGRTGGRGGATQGGGGAQRSGVSAKNGIRGQRSQKPSATSQAMNAAMRSAAVSSRMASMGGNETQQQAKKTDHGDQGSQPQGGDTGSKQ